MLDGLEIVGLGLSHSRWTYIPGFDALSPSSASSPSWDQPWKTVDVGICNNNNDVSRVMTLIFIQLDTCKASDIAI